MIQKALMWGMLLSINLAMARVLRSVRPVGPGRWPSSERSGMKLKGIMQLKAARERHEGTEARRHEVAEEGERDECGSASCALCTDPLIPCPSLRASMPSCLRAFCIS